LDIGNVDEAKPRHLSAKVVIWAETCGCAFEQKVRLVRGGLSNSQKQTANVFAHTGRSRAMVTYV